MNGLGDVGEATGDGREFRGLRKEIGGREN